MHFLYMTLSEARLRLYDLSLRSYEKVPCHKKFLEIDFRRSLFYEKLANLFDGLSWRSYKKLHIIKSSYNLITGSLFYEKLANLQKIATPL